MSAVRTTVTMLALFLAAACSAEVEGESDPCFDACDESNDPDAEHVDCEAVCADPDLSAQLVSKYCIDNPRACVDG
jgi:hypothetical protein